MSHFVVVLGILAAGSAAATGTAPHKGPSLTLFERPNYLGRHISFHAAAETARQAFVAHSARSTGVWTVCDGRAATSKCQTVNGDAATLKLEPAVVRPGVDAVALYEQPDLKGRRVIYSFASDQPPPFAARSARTWGGPWSLCDAASGRCQVIDGERPVAVEVQVGLVKPGRSAGRVQLAEASAPPAAPEPPLLKLTIAAPPTDEPAPPAEALPAPPLPIPAAPPDATPPPAAPPSAVLAEASPAPAAEATPSPYVDIPLPPRDEAPLSRQEAPAPPPREVALAPPPPPQAEQIRRVAYACEDGQGLTVLFDDGDQTAMVLVHDQDPLALRRSRDQGGGFFYRGSGHVLFGAGARAGFASEGAQPVDCYARGARRQVSSRAEAPYTASSDEDSPGDR